MGRRQPYMRSYRDDTGRILITRSYAAALGHRNRDHVEGLVQPVAYDVAAHAKHPPSAVCSPCEATAPALLDLDQVEDALRGREHRKLHRLRPID